jgi:hypothetical protein
MSLVGGPELLREWEKEWRERFGGEEADEVDEDVDDNEDADADGDDGDDAEDGDSDEDNGRAKKRARLEKERKQKATPAPPTEKRKRGRPRKNPIAEIPVYPPHLVLQPPDIAAQRQPANYLLAAFLLFNFFNPNTSASQPTQAHEGIVLSHTPSNTTSVALVDSTGWSVLQATNMLVSVLLLLSLLGPYIPRKLARLLPGALLVASPSSSTSSSRSQKTGKHDATTRDIMISRALASGDERALRSALGADGSLYSIIKTVALVALGRAKGALQTERLTEGVVARQDEIELRGWRRLSQMEVLRGTSHYVLCPKLSSHSINCHDRKEYITLQNPGILSFFVEATLLSLAVR